MVQCITLYNLLVSSESINYNIIFCCYKMREIIYESDKPHIYTHDNEIFLFGFCKFEKNKSLKKNL